MQMQLNVTESQGFSDYAEHLIRHVMQHSSKSRAKAVEYLDDNAGPGWRVKVAEYKKYENLKA